MNRRDFLRTAASIFPAAAFAGSGSISGAGERGRPDAFSVTVMTTRPTRIVYAMENALKHSAYAGHTVRLDESRLSGEQIADFAYVNSRGLIDYRSSTDNFAALLRQIASRYALPQPCEDPHLLRFSSMLGVSRPSAIDIFRGDILLERIALSGPASPSLRHIQGLKGTLDLAVENSSIRIVKASCRHKTCLKTGAISRPGEDLICIPNQVRITITGDRRIDGVTS